MDLQKNHLLSQEAAFAEKNDPFSFDSASDVTALARSSSYDFSGGGAVQLGLSPSPGKNKPPRSAGRATSSAHTPASSRGIAVKDSPGPAASVIPSHLIEDFGVERARLDELEVRGHGVRFMHAVDTVFPRSA